MPDTSILTRLLQTYLAIFTAGYGQTIDEAFWLLKAFVTLEVALMALWWAISEDNLVAVGLTKVFAVGVLTWLLTALPDLIDTLQQSFIRWGIVAGSTGGAVLTVADFTHPGNLFAYGAQVGVLLITHMSSIGSGWDFLWKGVELMIMGILALFVLAAFAILTIQVAVSLLEFYIGAVFAVLLLPAGAFRPLAFLAEKAIAYVLAHGVKLAVLAFIIAAAQPAFTYLSLPTHPTIPQVLSLCLAVGFLLALAWKGPGLAAGLLAGGPVFSAASVAQTAIAAGAMAGLGATGAARFAGGVVRGGVGTVQTGRDIVTAARTGGVQGVGRLAAVRTQQLAVNTLARFARPPAPHAGSAVFFTRLIPHD
jgi:type IV secretion system protein TrbL